MNTGKMSWSILVTVGALLLSACGTPAVPLLTPTLAVPLLTPMPAVPSLTPTPTTPPPAPAPTFPAASAPLVLQPPAPRPQTPISIGNATQVIELARWDAKDCAFAVSPNGAYLACASSVEGQPGGVYLYDLDRSAGLWFLPGESTAMPVFSPDSSMLVDGSGQVWETETGALRMEFPEIGADNVVRDFSFSSDGSQLAVSTEDGIQIWNFSDGTIKTIGIPQRMGVYSLAFSPDGTIIAAAYDQDKLILWNADNGEQITQFNYGGMWISSVAFSPDGQYIAAGTTDGKALILLTSNLEVVHTLDVADTFWVTGVAFSPDGAILVAGELSSMKLWNVADGSLLATLEISGGFQNYFTFTTDNLSLTLYTPMGDESVIQWFGIP